LASAALNIISTVSNRPVSTLESASNPTTRRSTMSTIGW